MRRYLAEENMLPTVRLVRRFSSGEKIKPGQSTPTRVVTGYEMGMYLTDGGEIAINGESYALSRYDVRFLREGDVVSSRPEYTCLSIYFDFGEIGVFHHNELLDAIPSFFSGTKEMLRLFERIETAVGRGNVGNAVTVNTCMLELLARFYLQFHSRETYSKPVLSCMEYMKAHLDEPVTLEELGKLTDYSALHIQRLFRRDTQQTPHDYLTALRMSRARELLTDEEISVTMIAEQCGFESESHFQSLFKKQTGMTPGKYRRHARNMI